MGDLLDLRAFSDVCQSFAELYRVENFDTVVDMVFFHTLDDGRGAAALDAQAVTFLLHGLGDGLDRRPFMDQTEVAHPVLELLGPDPTDRACLLRPCRRITVEAGDDLRDLAGELARG